MKPFVERISVIFVLLCVMQCVIGSEVEHTKSWGDLLSTGSYFTKKETRTGFPFFRREITLTYPRDFVNPEVEEFPVEISSIKGINYVEKSDDSCVPESEIIDGGIDLRYATIKITSARGCGLHATVTVLVQRPY